MSNDVSVLRPVMVGTAAVDVRYGSDILKIHPTEQLPNFTGELDGAYEVRTCKVNTRTGTKEIKIVFSNAIEARWLNRNSPIMTCPDVRAGERILVWRNADSEEYYWESLGIDRHLRDTEHFIIAISNTNKSDKSNKYLDLTNCYIFEMDSTNKKIGFYTNKNDGEPFAYDLKLDTKAGNYVIRDDVGNRILLDSANTLIELLNKDKTLHQLNKKDIFVYCEGNRRMEIGGNNTEIIHGNNYRTVDKDEDVKITGKQSSKIDGGTSLVTPTYKCKSQSNNWQCPMSSFSGHVNAASLAIGASAMSFMVLPSGYNAPRIAERAPVAYTLARSGIVGTITGDFKVIGSMNITNNLTVGSNISAGGTISAPTCNFSAGTVPKCPGAH